MYIQGSEMESHYLGGGNSEVGVLSREERGHVVSCLRVVMSWMC